MGTHRGCRAVSKLVKSDTYPDVDAFAELSRSESTSNNDESAINVGVAASYEVDLWGAIESRVRAETLRAEATVADYETAAISLSSLVAITWYQLVETTLQLELIESQNQTNQKTLEALQDRFRVGQIRNVDVLRQRNLIEATKEQAIILRARQAVLEHQLAALEGRVPQVKVDLAPTRLPALPPTPKTGLASTLLQRRPDVKAALLQVGAADEDVAAAVSDQYPRLNITASLETFAERPKDLFQDWIFSIAAQMIAPIIDGDERKAEVERSQAVRRQRLAEYGQTVLQAFVEVENALAEEARQGERIANLNTQVEIAEQTIKELRLQYFNGVADYLDVLQASISLQELERDVLRANLDRVLIRIALYRALAGSFETPRSKNDPQQTKPRD